MNTACEKDDNIGVASLLSIKVKECHKIYLHLAISDVERKKASTILAGMGMHIEPQVNVIYETDIFNKNGQQRKGSILSYNQGQRSLRHTEQIYKTQIIVRATIRS